jgi:hypothetical protein
MASSGRPSSTTAVAIASACAFAIIATQVAGKATRDALFLTNFDITALPLMLMASALISIGAVLFTARGLRGSTFHNSPLFFTSGLLLVAEWLFATRNPNLGRSSTCTSP